MIILLEKIKKYHQNFKKKKAQEMKKVKCRSPTQNTLFLFAGINNPNGLRRYISER
jgi:hypothetical protein